MQQSMMRIFFVILLVALMLGIFECDGRPIIKNVDTPFKLEKPCWVTDLTSTCEDINQLQKTHANVLFFVGISDPMSTEASAADNALDNCIQKIMTYVQTDGLREVFKGSGYEGSKTFNEIKKSTTDIQIMSRLGKVFGISFIKSYTNRVLAERSSFRIEYYQTYGLCIINESHLRKSSAILAILAIMQSDIDNKDEVVGWLKSMYSLTDTDLHGQ